MVFENKVVDECQFVKLNLQERKMFKNMIKEFKTFALKGNVLDMAIGIIIGASFSKIVDSLVKDVLMPPLGMLLGKVDFSNLKIALGSEPDAATINYGAFINNVISFIIVAFAVFLLIKGINTVRAKMEKAEAAVSAPKTEKTCPYCFSQISIKATRCPHCTS